MDNKTNTPEPSEGLEDQEKLDKIRYFKGSFQDLKDIMDKKAKENTNAMDEVDYKYPQERKGKDTSPVYQTYGIVNNPKKVYEMKNIKPFEEFNEGEYYVAGFGAPAYGGAMPAGYGLAWPDYRSYTGYSMEPVMGIVGGLNECLEQEAMTYENNDNPDHTAKSYLKEAHKCIMEKLNECYEKHGVNEYVQDITQNAPVNVSAVPESYDYESDELDEAYDAAKKTQVIKDRNVRNQKSMEMAKVKGDKTGEEMYKMKIQVDQLDMQKAKLKGEISKIQDERKAQREKIQQISK